MENENENELVGKHIKIIKTDGFVKYGLCMIVTESYVQIRYRDGNQEMIPIPQIKAVVSENGVENVADR